MAKHHSKEFEAYLEQLVKLGFRTRCNGVTIILYPPIKNYPMMTAHRGAKGMHHIRRYLKKYLAYISNIKDTSSDEK